MLRQFVRASAIAAAIAALMLASAFAPVSGQAFAQVPGSDSGSSRPSIQLNPEMPPTPQQIEKRRATDDAYNAAMKKIPDKKSSADPWGDIRPAAKTKQQQQQVQ